VARPAGEAEVKGWNWRRGLLRLWLVASVLWVACVGFVVWPLPLGTDDAARQAQPGRPLDLGVLTPEQFLKKYEGGPGTGLPAAVQPPKRQTGELIETVAALMLLPPLGVLAIGLALSWAARGSSRAAVSEVRCTA
jgi:hypothetical protein